MRPYRFPKTIFSKVHDLLITMLKDARKKAGLTQVQAAEKLGCRQTFISKIECGERRIDVVEFAIFCQAYRVSPSKFFDRLLNDLKRKGVTQANLRKNHAQSA